MLQGVLLLVISWGAVSEGTLCRSSLTLEANYSKQYLTSPSYPDLYPRPLSCTWTLTASQGNVIIFRFWYFEIDTSVLCYRDLFTIIDGPTDYHPELISLCGSYSSTSIHRSTAASTIVKFVAVNPGALSKGFNISFWTEDRMDLPYREPSYTVGHYILMGVSGLVLATFLIGLLVLLKPLLPLLYEACQGDYEIVDEDEAYLSTNYADRGDDNDDKDAGGAGNKDDNADNAHNADNDTQHVIKEEMLEDRLSKHDVEQTPVVKIIIERPQSSDTHL